jgi:putative hydrolase of HD superfamily
MSDVIDRLLVALNAHDTDAFVDCYAEDATIENGHDTVMARGHDELREKYGGMFEQLPDIRVQAVKRTDIGDFVVQEELVTGRGEPERHIAVYLVREDRILRERLLR